MPSIRSAILPAVLALTVSAAPALALQTKPQNAKPAPTLPANPPARQTAKNLRPSGPLVFHGYACTIECSLLQEGYAWASSRQLSNPADCRGTSETFIDGCRAFTGIRGPFGGREFDPSFPHMIGIE
jgi:hypothetical protein